MTMSLVDDRPLLPDNDDVSGVIIYCDRHPSWWKCVPERWHRFQGKTYKRNVCDISKKGQCTYRFEVILINEPYRLVHGRKYDM